MLEDSDRKIRERLADDALVLDVGGWAKPFPRADWVIDLLPYETRGLYAREELHELEEERFSADTWIQRDICEHERWPFRDGQFDFAICSQTLEDVRDPVWVCSELRRVAKAGYIEVPSRLEEQTYGVQGPWAGWGHHHWLIEVVGNRIEFVFKHHILHGRPEFQISRAVWESAVPEARVERLWWEGTFEASERVVMDGDELDRWLEEPVVLNDRDETSALVSEADGPPPAHAVDFVRSLPQAATALDLGCRDPRLTRELNVRELTAMCVSRAGVERARTLLPGSRVLPVHLDRRLPFPSGAFELALCASMVEHAPDAEFVLSELRRVLVPDGILALTTRAHDRLRGVDVMVRGFERSFPPAAAELRFFTSRSLAGLLDELGFRPESIQRRRRTLLARARAQG